MCTSGPEVLAVLLHNTQGTSRWRRPNMFRIQWIPYDYISATTASLSPPPGLFRMIRISSVVARIVWTLC